MSDRADEIIGYRELDESAVEVINCVKLAAEAVGELVDSMGDVEGIDQRWLAIARTELQQGFMALTRAIARPETF